MISLELDAVTTDDGRLRMAPVRRRLAADPVYRALCDIERMLDAPCADCTDGPCDCVRSDRWR